MYGDLYTHLDDNYEAIKYVKKIENRNYSTETTNAFIPVYGQSDR